MSGAEEAGSKGEEVSGANITLKRRGRTPAHAQRDKIYKAPINKGVHPERSVTLRKSAGAEHFVASLTLLL